ncbi:MAG TPA: endolytic transglycosylase MltG [Burkholderiales bacterium]|nr:endolytic transglycosylase MltG [Burkholderiales bacterium]
MLSRLKLLLLAISAAILGFCGWQIWIALSPIQLASPTVDFSIRPGSSLRGATRQLIEAGLPLTEWEFVLLARVNGASAAIKAGSYQVAAGVTPLLLLRKITRGEYAQAEILFPEGWTFRQMREAMGGHPDLKHDSAGLTEAAIMEKLGDAGSVAEGMFFPDTYIFAKGSSDLAVLARARRAMKRQLEAAWATRDVGLPVGDPYEALILASIVEKETGRSSDRAMVAAVFTNRLRLKMKLQTDPSVIYGMGEEFDGNLRKRDLVRDTPFNTYTRLGLPPHPIAMPGLASLTAVTHPAKSDALYFVSRGDGTSEFSRTLIEHNRAVARYQMPGARRRAVP